MNDQELIRLKDLEIIKNAKRVYLIGNGGSYANAMHICNDLLSKGVKAYTMDPSTLTAFANDYGYRRAFALWIDGVGESGDVLIALSGSGTSPNILEAIAVANGLGMTVITVFGAAMGHNMQRAEEYQLEWGHLIWRNL